MGLVIKEGTLLKAPPEAKAKNKSSWHERHCVLVEIGQNDKLNTKKTRRKSLGYMKSGDKYTEDENSVEVGRDTYLMYWNNITEKKKGRKYKGKTACYLSLIHI